MKGKKNMKEWMLEILTYEPFGEFLPVEEKYIHEILSEILPQPKSMFHDLFSGFYDYAQRGELKNIGWLQCWTNIYSSQHPLLFRKICFFIIVRGEFTDKEFMELLNLRENLIRKWKMSTRFRRYAEANSYSVIKSFRNGVKKEYIVSIVKKLYYEAGRQVSESTKLKDLPTFTDVFAGTGSVAASVVSDGCPIPIINDYDPIAICFAWAFTHRQSELRKRIAEFHKDLMEQDFESTEWSYTADEYESYCESKDPQSLRLNLKKWDSPKTLSILKDYWGYSEARIQEERMLVQHYREFVIRARSSHRDVKLVIDSCDREALRNIDFNKLPPNSIDQIEDVLDYALAMFYYYSFPLSWNSGNANYETTVDVSSYLTYLKSLEVNLDDDQGEDNTDKARTLMELQLKADSLTLESIGHFSYYLRGAKFCCKDFEEILRDDPSNSKILQDGPPNRIYYLDSPYFLTVGYDVGFSDDKHKIMLDILRDAGFKWIFSMQYNPSNKRTCTSASDEAKRKKHHIIKDYGAYYRGFYAPLEVDTDQRTYVIPDASMEDKENLKRLKELYVILFDFNEVKKKWPKMNTETKEMLVVNFNCLRVIPLHDTAVMLPFDLFLQCADKKMKYKDIVDLAIAWRKDYIIKNYTGKSPD